MNSNCLNIIIAGESNSGKSTMMLQIEKLLIENGFNVELSLIGHPDYSGENSYHFRNKENIDFDKKIEQIKRNKKIILHEVKNVTTSVNGKEISNIKRLTL